MIQIFSEQHIQTDNLLNDTDITRALNFSDSWVRQQRRLRRKGQKHALTIDPVMVGEKPRYTAEEFREWLQRLKTEKQPPGTAPSDIERDGASGPVGL
jgi:hypothetical protein